ncbi:MAG: hypothetical protein M3036_11360, partial [Bifidobacteriales bacterium]|nr:hypothetical protein [Bifidobacteriales bacterium]
ITVSERIETLQMYHVGHADPFRLPERIRWHRLADSGNRVTCDCRFWLFSSSGMWQNNRAW